MFIVHRVDFHNGNFFCVMCPLTMTSFYTALFSHCFLPSTQYSERRSVSHLLPFPSLPFQHMFGFVFPDLFHLVFHFPGVKSLPDIYFFNNRSITAQLAPSFPLLMATPNNTTSFRFLKNKLELMSFPDQMPCKVMQFPSWPTFMQRQREAAASMT